VRSGQTAARQPVRSRQRKEDLLARSALGEERGRTRPKGPARPVPDEGKEARRAESHVERLRIKTPGVRQLAMNLSGGNQQKLIVARWLACESRIFVFDEPTVGVDVGAKVEIYRLFEQLLKEGAAIVVISSYLPEVMGLADRVAVMSEGRIMRELSRSEFTKDGRMDEEMLVRLASGIAG
jgi:ribose transport system ATP-binding protein